MRAYLRSLQWLKSILLIVAMACFATAVFVDTFDIEAQSFLAYLVFVLILVFIGLLSWLVPHGTQEPRDHLSKE